MKRRLRPPPILAVQASGAKPGSFKLTETTFLGDVGHTGSFKIRIDSNGAGFASPLTHAHFRGKLTLESIEPLEELGQGTSAVVRLARHRPTGKALALKIINLREKAKRDMLLNELKVLRRVQHPHLVNLFDCFQLDGYAYLALQYMDGGSAEQMLAAYQCLARPAGLASLGLPEDVLRAVTLQILMGLDHLHRAVNLIHRDLKPANILIDAATGVVALSDFGIARQMGDSLVAQSFVGSAAYMAPERINGHAYGPPADIWSLGIILVECAVGTHPYRNSTSYFELVCEVSEGANPPRLPEDAGHSPSLAAMSQGCLFADAIDRPTSHALLQHAFVQKNGFDGYKEAPSTAASLQARLQHLGILDTGDEGLAHRGQNAARFFAQWLADTFAPAADPARAAMDGIVPESTTDEQGHDDATAERPPCPCSEREGMLSEAPEAARRIQAHLRGSTVRRELDELRQLEAALSDGKMSLD